MSPLIITPSKTHTKFTLICNVNKKMHPLLIPNLYTTSHLQYARPNLFDSRSMGISKDLLNLQTSINSFQSTESLSFISQRSSVLQSPKFVNSLNVNTYNTDSSSEKDNSFEAIRIDNNSSQPSSLSNLAFKFDSNITPANSISIDTIDIKKDSEKDIKQFMKNNKRQRVGPSCDNCRAKKVRCDARIEVLVKDNSILSQLSSKLNYILEDNDIDTISNTFLKNVTLPVELRTKGSKLKLLKHLDKIVLFSPCSSCIKINNKRKLKFSKKRRKRKCQIDTESVGNNCSSIADEYFCAFSKGLSKSDISIFQKLYDKTEKNINELTINDYQDAGYK